MQNVDFSPFLGINMTIFRSKIFLNVHSLVHFEEKEFWGYSCWISLSTGNTLRLLLFFGQIWVLALIFNTLIDHTACRPKNSSFQFIIHQQLFPEKLVKHLRHQKTLSTEIGSSPNPNLEKQKNVSFFSLF